MRYKYIKYILSVLSTIIIGCTFVLCSYAAIAGDIEEPAGVQISDARLVLRRAINLNDNLTDLQIDKCDYDYDSEVTVKDARAVIRVAVRLDKEKHYMAYSVDVPATCTTDGTYIRTCTECSECEPISGIIVSPGHDYQIQEILKNETCTEPGSASEKCSVCGDIRITEIPASHKLKDATCTEAAVCTVCNTSIGSPLGHDWEKATCIQKKTCRICGISEGDFLGHTTRIGYCKTCGNYIDELKGTADEIISLLNGGLKKTNEAYARIDEGVNTGFTNILINCSAEAKELYKSAYNDYFLKAYALCGKYPEFSAAKEIIKKIMDEVLKSYNLLPLEESGYLDNLINIDNSMDLINNQQTGLKYKLKEQTELWKEKKPV